MQNAGFDQLPLEWIRAFETAARLGGSFTAAATETGLTQSAISQRIAHLEKRLGARLFTREARRIALTAEGEAWLPPHVQAALSGGLRDSSEALFGVARNRLTLSASASIIELWLVPRLARLTAETGAQVKLRTMVVASDEAKDDTAIRVIYGSGDWPVAYKRPLYDEEFGLVATPDLLARGGRWPPCRGWRWPDRAPPAGGGTGATRPVWPPRRCRSCGLTPSRWALPPRGPGLAC